MMRASRRCTGSSWSTHRSIDGDVEVDRRRRDRELRRRRSGRRQNHAGRHQADRHQFGIRGLRNSVPVGVATIVTQLPGRPAQVPKTPLAGLGGAV